MSPAPLSGSKESPSPVAVGASDVPWATAEPHRGVPTMGWKPRAPDSWLTASLMRGLQEVGAPAGTHREC